MESETESKSFYCGSWNGIGIGNGIRFVFTNKKVFAWYSDHKCFQHEIERARSINLLSLPLAPRLKTLAYNIPIKNKNKTKSSYGSQVMASRTLLLHEI